MPTMEKAIKSLNGKKVVVGVSGADNAYLAMIHEYGCKIQVTDKMRAYLHRHGLHLADSTEYKLPHLLEVADLGFTQR